MEIEGAVILSIKDIKNSNFIHSEDFNSPSHIVYNGLNISEINVLGVVVNKSNNSITIEDGTGNIEIRFFDDDKIDSLNISDTVLSIARPRRYNEKLYLSPRIVKKIEDEKMLKLRKTKKEFFSLWLDKISKEENKTSNDKDSNKKEDKNKIEVNKETIKNEDNEKETIDFDLEDDESDKEVSSQAKDAIEESNGKKELLQYIKKNDPGDGADYEKIIDEFGMEIDDKLNKLLEEGDIFEVRAGKYKVLD
ncbi:MAG: hypothetical protein ACOCRX_00530 [Candidatus Woesearchaeota archaeon]